MPSLALALASPGHARASLALSAHARAAARRRSQWGWTPLHLAANNKASEGVIKLLIAANPDAIHATNDNGERPKDLAQTAEVRALEASLSFTVVATDAGALHLQAKSREQLLLWWSGLQALSSVPDTARKSRGALLWQILRYRLREKGHIGGKVAPIAFKDL